MAETWAERSARWDREGTPTLEEFLPLYEDDDNVWWAMQSGHHQNLFDEAVERWREVKAASRPEVLAIPDEGRVLFLLTTPAQDSFEDVTAAAEALKRTADEVAPGRGFCAVLSDDLRLDVLGEEDLRRLGLQRISEAERG